MSIDITARSGPLKGARFTIEEGGSLLIGRTRRGVNLPDPKVSLQHAKVMWARGGFVLEDLGSTTGTFVNGIRLVPGKPMPIEIGDTFVIGDTTFRVDNATQRAYRVALFAAIPSALLVLVAAGLAFWNTGERPITLTLNAPIHTHDGEVDALTFPRAFLRRYGVRVQDLRLRRTTDLDGDGVDEIWLRTGERELVIGFAPDGAWTLLAELPLGCTPRSDGDIQCADALFRRTHRVYEEIVHDHPTVWLLGSPDPPAPEPTDDGKPEAKAPDEPPEPPPLPEGAAVLQRGGLLPVRALLGDADRAAGFLADRGVLKPVHYVLCEDAIPGLPAQAVLADATAVPLARSCGSGVTLDGPRASGYRGTRIAAIAFSAAGRARLAEHLSYTFSGSERPLFLDESQRALVEQVDAWPIRTRGGLRLAWRSTPHVFSPTAEGLLPARVGLLADFTRPPDVVSAVLTAPADLTLDVPGCSSIQVQAASFRCALLRGCLPGSTFIHVRDTGCGTTTPLLDVGYGPGLWEGSSERVDVRVELETDGSFTLRDVVRAEVAVRPR